MRGKGNLYGQRRGLRLYFWSLWYYFIPLLEINVLFILCCLPVVTVGPAITAMSRICCLLAAGKPLIYPVREFWDTFRGSFRQSFGPGILGIGYGLALCYSFWLLNTIGNRSLILRLVLLLAGAVFALCLQYVFPQIAMLRLGLGQILGNALRLMLVRPGASLGGVLTGGLVLLGPLYFWPMSMLMYFVLLFSAAGLACCCFAWPGIERYLVKEDGEHDDG